MGSPFIVNRDGSVSQPQVKTIKNISWIDHAQFKGKYPLLQILGMLLFCVPVYGWALYLIFGFLSMIEYGFWPFFGITAIEDTPDDIKIYCNKHGKLGLYAKASRITGPHYDSIQSLPTPDYPSFIMERTGKFAVFNYTQRKLLFKDSDKITYVGDNTVVVEKNGKSTKYSLIGMRLG